MSPRSPYLTFFIFLIASRRFLSLAALPAKVEHDKSGWNLNCKPPLSAYTRGSKIFNLSIMCLSLSSLVKLFFRKKKTRRDTETEKERKIQTERDNLVIWVSRMGLWEYFVLTRPRSNMTTTSAVVVAIVHNSLEIDWTTAIAQELLSLNANTTKDIIFTFTCFTHSVVHPNETWHLEINYRDLLFPSRAENDPLPFRIRSQNIHALLVPLLRITEFTIYHISAAMTVLISRLPGQKSPLYFSSCSSFLSSFRLAL